MSWIFPFSSKEITKNYFKCIRPACTTKGSGTLIRLPNWTTCQCFTHLRNFEAKASTWTPAVDNIHRGHKEIPTFVLLIGPAKKVTASSPMLQLHSTLVLHVCFAYLLLQHFLLIFDCHATITYTHASKYKLCSSWFCNVHYESSHFLMYLSIFRN